jgi:Holliday junction DNA helicase RuvA
MIDHIKGILIEKKPTRIVVDCGGVGYGINISLPTYEKLGNTGQIAELYTYLHVREDVLQLYGFYREVEKEMFLLLISVSKIGPKTAQGVLSGISVENFIHAIRGGDISALIKIPGIGRQTAERLIIELKDKVKKLDIGATAGTGEGRAIGILTGAAEEAASALESLGYKRVYAENAISRVVKEKGDGISLEEMIKSALKYI